MSLVLSYSQARKVFDDAKEKHYALPAVNVTGTNTDNATLETASKENSPVIIQFSNSGGAFFSGKSRDKKNQQANIIG
jgi:fructose-bisphosphate aldolase class II